MSNPLNGSTIIVKDTGAETIQVDLSAGGPSRAQALRSALLSSSGSIIIKEPDNNGFDLFDTTALPETGLQVSRKALLASGGHPVDDGPAAVHGPGEESRAASNRRMLLFSSGGIKIPAGEGEEGLAFFDSPAIPAEAHSNLRRSQNRRALMASSGSVKINPNGDDGEGLDFFSGPGAETSASDLLRSQNLTALRASSGSIKIPPNVEEDAELDFYSGATETLASSSELRRSQNRSALRASSGSIKIASSSLEEKQGLDFYSTAEQLRANTAAAAAGIDEYGEGSEDSDDDFFGEKTAYLEYLQRIAAEEDALRATDDYYEDEEDEEDDDDPEVEAIVRCRKHKESQSYALGKSVIRETAEYLVKWKNSTELEWLGEEDVLDLAPGALYRFQRAKEQKAGLAEGIRQYELEAKRKLHDARRRVGNPERAELRDELKDDPVNVEKLKPWAKADLTPAPATAGSAAGAAAPIAAPQATPSTAPVVAKKQAGAPRLRGRVPTLRSLAVDCMAEHLLLYDGIGELPMQYRAPIFISLLRRKELTSDHLKILVGADQKTLDLSSAMTLVSDEHIAVLGNQTPLLVSLKLAGCDFITDASLIGDILGDMKMLTSLDLSGLTKVKSLRTLYKLENLSHLTLAGCSALADAHGIQALKKLVYVNVNECVSMLPGDALKALSSCPQLVTLLTKYVGAKKSKFYSKYEDLTQNVWDPAQQTIVAVDLEELDLSRNREWIHHALTSLVMLIRSRCPKFSKLSIAYTPFIGAPKHNLFEKLHMLPLVYLDASSMQAPDTFSQIFNQRGSLIYPSTLTYLDLSESGHVGDPLVAFFPLRHDMINDKKPYKRFPNLRVLKVANSILVEPLSLIRVFRNTVCPLEELHLHGIGAQLGTRAPQPQHYYHRRLHSDSDNVSALIMRWIQPKELDWATLKLAVQPKLKKLYLGHMWWAEHHHLLAVLSCAPNLTSLTLSALPGVTNNLFRKLPELFPHLTTLRIEKSPYNVNPSVTSALLAGVSHPGLRARFLRVSVAVSKLTPPQEFELVEEEILKNMATDAVAGFRGLRRLRLQARHSIHRLHRFLLDLDYPPELTTVELFCLNLEYKHLAQLATENEWKRLDFSDCMYVYGDSSVTALPAGSSGCTLAPQDCSCARGRAMAHLSPALDYALRTIIV